MAIDQVRSRTREIPDDDIIPETLCPKVRCIITNITVEPILILFILPSIMAKLTTQNLSLEKACRVNLQYDPEICDALAIRNTSGYNETDEIAIHQLVATMYTWKNIIHSIFPPFLLIFLGSWSDRHYRRKPCFILPIFGELVTSVGFLLCTYFFYELPMEFNGIVEALPSAFTCGAFAVYLGAYSYISGKTSVEKRTFRIGAVNMVNNVSHTIGIALSGVLYKYMGFFGVFSLSFVLYMAAMSYGYFVFEEIKAPAKAVLQKDVGFFKDFFDIQHIKTTLKVACKDGKRNRKKTICVIMVLIIVILGPVNGEMNVMYLFVRQKYQWNEIDYSIFATFSIILHIFGTVFALSFFSNFLKMDDGLLGLISVTSKVCSCLVYAFAQNPSTFYLGAVVEMLNGTSFIAMRSIISKLVPPDELGQINSLFGVCEALMPLVYGPMYTMVYKATIKDLPGAFFLLGGGLTLPAVFIFLWLYSENKKDLREEKKSNSPNLYLKGAKPEEIKLVNKNIY